MLSSAQLPVIQKFPLSCTMIGTIFRKKPSRCKICLSFWICYREATTTELFRKIYEKQFPLDTVELVNTVLSCLDISDERFTDIEIIEQQCYNHGERITSSFSTKSHVAVNEVSATPLIPWFVSIRPRFPKRCCNIWLKLLSNSF